MIDNLEKEISVLLCKLEKIFTPGWFNLMEYLLIYFPYEDKVGGPYQYRWMYHIERALKKLRTMIDNKVRVEGYITEKFKLKEITYITSLYFIVEHHNVNSPTMHLQDFEELCATLMILGLNHETIKWKTFPFSLTRWKKQWYKVHVYNCHGSWSILKDQFCFTFFPLSKTIDLHNVVLSFTQKEGESIRAT
jgi:hypothetical protein